MVALLAPHNTPDIHGPDSDGPDSDSPDSDSPEVGTLRAGHLKLVPAQSAPLPTAALASGPVLASVSALRPVPAPNQLAVRRPAPVQAPELNFGQLAAAALGAAMLLGLVFSFSRPGPPAATWAEVQESVVGAQIAPTTGERTVLVKSGDTLWAIAAQLAPNQDRRQVVGLLERRNGGSQLQAGQLLIVPDGLEPQS